MDRVHPWTESVLWCGPRASKDRERPSTGALESSAPRQSSQVPPTTIPSCRPNLLLPRVGRGSRASHGMWCGPRASKDRERPSTSALLESCAARCHHLPTLLPTQLHTVAPGRGRLVEAATEQRFDGRRARAGPVTLRGSLRTECIRGPDRPSLPADLHR